MLGENSNNKSIKNILLGYTLQDRLFASKLSLFLKKIVFREQKFLASILIFDIKYNYLGSQNNNTFYWFNNQLNYTLTHYFREFKTTKDNLDRFLSNQLMAQIKKKLSYQNVDK